VARRGDIKGSGEPLCPRALPLTRSAAPPVPRRLHRGRARLFGWVLAALAPTLTPVLPAAYAQAPTGGELSAQLATLEAQIRELEQGLPTPTGETAPAAPAAVGGRLTDARALFALRNFTAAAALLRDLVARGPASAEYGAALDLLAEALWAQGEYREAEQWFTALVELQPPHPRAQHGLLRLLDIATHLHSEPSAERWLEALGRIPAAAQLPEAAYGIGKFQFMRREYAAAVAALTPIAASSPYYVRARYLIGAAAVARGELPAATAEFLALTARPLPDSDDDRRVLELSQMALGRIYHELGQSAKAHTAYLHISQKSNLFKDAIYEAAWSAIRAKDYPRAEQALELLLLAYRDAPQASYAAAEAKLLLGNLQLRRGEPDSALDWFERARKELQPLLAQLGDLLGQHGEPAQRVRALIEQNLRSFDLGQVSPAPVRPLIAADPEVQRFLALQRELGETERTLGELEALLQSLDKQLLTGAHRFRLAPELRAPRARSHALFRQLFQLHRTLGEQLEPLLGGAASPPEAEMLRALLARRTQLQQELSAAAGGESDVLDATSAQRRAHTELLAQEQALWQSLSVRLADGPRAQAEGLVQAAARLGTADAALRAVSGRLDRMLDVKVGDVQSTVGSERDKLRSYRDSLRALTQDSAQLGGAVVGSVGAQAAQRFAEILVRADAGVVDAAWARKVRSSDQVAQLVRDQKRELRILDEEFDPGGELLGSAKLTAKAATKSAADSPNQPAQPDDKPGPTDAAAPSQKDAAASAPVELPPGLPDEVAADYQRYLEAGKSYRATVEEFAREAYPRRRQQLGDRYAVQIKAGEREEKLRRAQALTQFEDFLGRYPHHPRYTPEAMFRLAELYFERSSEDFIAAVKLQGESETGVGLPDYSRSVELYRRLLRDYPGYRNSDGAHYLLGYCLGEMGQEAESRQAFLGLVCHNKYAPLDPPPVIDRKTARTQNPYNGCTPLQGESRFLAEAWTRIGEHHFDRGELEPAIYAYSQVLPFKDSPYFDKALYKLAWSYYRADRFPEAVRRFDELVVLADRKQHGDATEKKEGSSLRGESIQYLALSFAERDWDGDGRDDEDAGLLRAVAHYRGREAEPHVREVFARMGDLLFDRTDFGRAGEVYKYTLDHWPAAADNPKLQERIVAAYERQRLFEQALREREALAKNYLAGSPWYEKNRNNPSALEQAQELAEASLMNAVLRRHDSAQLLREKAVAQKDPKLLAQAALEYQKAADSYETYLQQHPSGKHAYEYSYYLAESLFYGQKYPEAAAAYERCRDADPAGKFAEDAAYGAVKSREEAVAALYRSGEAVEPPLPVVGKVTPPVQPLPMPEGVSKLQAAYDRYAALLPGSDKTAVIAYKAAELDFRFLRFPAARMRFQSLLAQHCKSERAVDAGNALLVSYTIENDLDHIEEWTGRIKAAGCGAGTALAQSQAGNIQKLSAQVRFKKAERLLEEKQYAAAASLFVQLVDQDPRGVDSDKAVFNAAVANENLKRFGAATEQYERVVRDYPQSNLLDEALFRAAVNHQRFFAFDKAVAAYKALATEARFKNAPHRHDALYNAALISENDQSYAQAVELWTKYARDEKTSPEEAAQASFRAARATEKLGSPARAEQELSQFVAKYGKDERRLPQVVEAHYRLARLQTQQKDPTGATESLRKTAQLGAKLPPGSDGAEFAAEAAFQLAERRLADLEKQRITGSGRELESSIADFNKKVNEAVVEYDKVLGYRRANWTLAAYFRMGYVFELYGKALLAAPCPPEVKRLGAEACDLYRTKIEENVAGIEDKAVARYVVTLEQAGRLGVANTWTKLARTRANAYRPEQFPLIKDEHVAQQLLPDSSLAFRPAGSGETAQLLGEARSALLAGQNENAIVLGKLALSKDDRFVPAMLTLAQAYYFLGKRELAAAIIGVAQSIEPDNAEAYLVLGFLALAKDDRIAATAAFKKASELDPSFGLAWHNLAAQYLHAKNYPQALQAAQRAVQLFPGPGLVGAQLNLGSALRGVRRFDEALAEYQRVLGRDPSYADAYFNLGVLHLDAPQLAGLDAVGQRSAAIQYLMRYQDLAGTRGGRDDAAEAYIKEAKAAIEREQRKQQRKQKTTGELAPPPAALGSQSSLAAVANQTTLEAGR
jgi:tetratricopeptide (TPR) repeat protein